MANKTEDVIFRRGPAATMPQEKHSGTLLVESDTGNVFVDDSDEVRVQLTDTSKISRHGDKFDNDVELDFPSETEGKSSKLSSDNINFKMVKTLLNSTVTDLMVANKSLIIYEKVRCSRSFRLGIYLIYV